jgi:hypothetical protein
LSLIAFVRIAKSIKDALNISNEEAVNSSPIPEEYKQQVLAELQAEDVMEVRDLHMVEDRQRDHVEWLSRVDRANWYYWPRLRNYLIDLKNWPIATVRSIDNSTDRILGAMENPVERDEFNTRALGVGFVQSGKTANYSSLIAKAADTGYRLIIVLAGMHNSLRYQTQVRLDKELVGIINAQSVGVGYPRPDKLWHTFTKSDLLNGEFNPGNASYAALNGSNPVLVVIKKNGPVLRRLIEWLERSQESTKRNLPCLIIDDEADQASVNTGGNRPHDWDPEEQNEAEENPSTINELIRQLLNLFSKKAYIAYTATPFANVLIDHEAHDAIAGRDLYPHSFIMALPRPHGYFGAEEIFGNFENNNGGMNIIRNVPRTEVSQLVPASRREVETFQPTLVDTLQQAIVDFILTGAARLKRGQGELPSSMLIHTSYRTQIQERLATLIRSYLDNIRDEWRYNREENPFTDEFSQRWDSEFRPLTRSINLEFDYTFDEIFDEISTFLEQVTVRELHGNSNDEVNYEIEPSLKAIVIGGNRLSRGLTLEGLLISYFVRTSQQYSFDTLMQMGRWFGFREGYVDLTRIYTTRQLARWFRDLSIIEADLHRDISRYENEGLTPLQVGVRIRQHPAMLVTSRLKSRSSQTINVSYSNKLVQTIAFPFNDSEWLLENLEITRGFLSSLGTPHNMDNPNKPLWSNIESNAIIEFLDNFQTDPDATIVIAERLRDYIIRQNEYGELTNWTVSVLGRNTLNADLNSIDLQIDGLDNINLIKRSKLIGFDSLGAIVSDQDHEVGMTEDEIAQAESLKRESNLTKNEALRHIRSVQEGVLLIYPISKYSSVFGDEQENREAIFDNPEEGEHIIGVAIIFPNSSTAATVEYAVGTVGADL